MYQPLTLLDCLHTFCGSCLKEWFYFQAQTATSIHPYTCPSCRASVLKTQPDARVNTLLELFLQANPSRGKTEQERLEIRKAYKPGDNVLPRLRKRRETAGEAEERRVVDEVREMSLREVGVSNNSLDVPRERTRDRTRRRERSGETHRSRARGTHSSRSRSRDAPLRSPANSHRSRQPSPSSPSQLTSGPRLEHQSSLRSILSGPEFDSQEIREEIMRQIMEDGLLNGIDFDNLDAAQEEEIAERIAEAYRRRHDAQHEDRRTRSSSNVSGTPPREGLHTRRRHHAQSESVLPRSPPAVSSRPPVSRPHLLEASQSEDGQRTRSFTSASAPRPEGRRRRSSDTQRPAGRSATDLTNNPESSQTVGEHRRRLSQTDRRATDPDRVQSRAQAVPASAPLPPLENGSPALPISRIHNTITRHANHSSPTVSESRNLLASPPVTAVRPSSSDHPASRPSLFTEPSISCNRCGRSNIEYDVHYNCPRCENANYNLCLRCYREGKGCLHWFGFGETAQIKYDREAPPGGYPPNHEQPHILVGHRYLHPRQQPVRSASGENGRVLTDEDPTKRLQAGVFCDICHEFANSCYWKCEDCNEGAWGFCNTCVNQGRHCAHPLLPLTRTSPTQQNESSLLEVPNTVDRSATNRLTTPTSTPPSSPPLTPKSASITRGPGHITTIAGFLFRDLTFTTHCDICNYPIPPSSTRYHCPRCNEGDYDICASCYIQLVNNGTISPENGHKGSWAPDRSRGFRRMVVRA